MRVNPDFLYREFEKLHKFAYFRQRGEVSMDEFELRRIILDYIKEISHYSQMQVFATSSYQKNYFQLQIDETTNGLINFFLVNRKDVMQQPELQQSILQQQVQPSQNSGIQQLELQPGMQMITMEELARNDGSQGNPSYVAVDGTVYDMSHVIQWSGGTHFGLVAGHNLSSEFTSCHKGMYEILDKLPKVGVLKT